VIVIDSNINIDHFLAFLATVFFFGAVFFTIFFGAAFFGATFFETFLATFLTGAVNIKIVG
jgi:polyferredoxin